MPKCSCCEYNGEFLEVVPGELECPECGGTVDTEEEIIDIDPRWLLKEEIDEDDEI